MGKEKVKEREGRREYEKRMERGIKGGKEKTRERRKRREGLV